MVRDLGHIILGESVVILGTLDNEWLEWNGTDKNDWFFVLWWGLVVVWFLKGLISLNQRLKK